MLWIKVSLRKAYRRTVTETNKAVGCLSLVMDKSVDNDPKENLFSIGNFYILPEYRGLRIGEKMFNLVMERTKGVNTVLQAGE